ncbi:hypothetical protein [Nocardia sp. X0981]
MHRTARTRRLAVRMVATAAIALAPLAVTAAPALAESGPAPSAEVQDVSRPGRHNHHHNGLGGGWRDRGHHNHGRHDHNVDWNRGHRHHPGWNRGWNRGRHDHGWNHGWNHGRHDHGWGHRHGLPFPRIFPFGTGSAF